MQGTAGTKSITVWMLVYFIRRCFGDIQTVFLAYEHLQAVHPQLKREKIIDIIQNMDEGKTPKKLPLYDDFEFSPEDYPDMIDAHFLTKYRDCDYNICHFSAVASVICGSIIHYKPIECNGIVETVKLTHQQHAVFRITSFVGCLHSVPNTRSTRQQHAERHSKGHRKRQTTDKRFSA